VEFEVACNSGDADGCNSLGEWHTVRRTRKQSCFFLVFRLDVGVCACAWCRCSRTTQRPQSPSSV
jgi:hypothetical protein